MRLCYTTVGEGLVIARVLQVSEDGRYVLLSIREGCDPVNRLWYCDLQTIPQGITGMVFCTDVDWSRSCDSSLVTEAMWLLPGSHFLLPSFL